MTTISSAIVENIKNITPEKVFNGVNKFFNPPTLLFNFDNADEVSNTDTFTHTTNEIENNDNSAPTNAENKIENRAKNNLEKLPNENDYDKLIKKYAKEADIEPALLKAFIRKESKFNKNAKNKYSSAKGLMQMIACTAKAYDVANPLDPEQSIKGGANLIKDLLKTFGNNKEKAILGYYQGIGGAKKLLKNGKTDKDGYVKEVMLFYKEYKKCFVNT